MSLPQNQESTLPVAGAFLPPENASTVGLEDYERGGVAIQDASQGLMGYTWRCYVVGLDVFIERVGSGAPTLLFQQSGITAIALAFDQNMRPAVAYRTTSNLTFLRWYDSVDQVYVTDSFGDLKDPRLTLDDKRPQSVQTSDIIFAYIRDANLCYRQQRDRYTVEYVLRAGLPADARLKTLGMSDVLRLQFEIV